MKKYKEDKASVMSATVKRRKTDFSIQKLKTKK